MLRKLPDRTGPRGAMELPSELRY